MGLFDNISRWDKDKAAKLLAWGIFIAIIFGTIIVISKSLAIGAADWRAYADAENLQNYQEGLYGYQEYLLRQDEISRMELWMGYQEIIFVNLARIGINIGLFLTFLGFVGFATNNSLDDQTRRTALIIAAIVIFVMMLTTFYTQISIQAT